MDDYVAKHNASLREKNDKKKYDSVLTKKDALAQMIRKENLMQSKDFKKQNLEKMQEMQRQKLQKVMTEE